MGPPDGVGTEEGAHLVGSKSHRILGALFKDMDIRQYLLLMLHKCSANVTSQGGSVYQVNILLGYFQSLCSDPGRWEALKFRFYGPDSEPSPE